ncbi:MAG: MarR family winged helix-turn-helix transcriptional regulator [Microvirga sp.]|jgi:DNA-binding MarR family transcriptional regulator
MSEIAAIGRACFALHARMTARLLTRAYDAALRPLGLNVPQFGILGAIDHGTAESETALAERLGLERTTLVRNLKVLSDKGWIELVPGSGRGLRHRLTPKGKSTLTEAIPLWRAAQDRIEANLAAIDPESARQVLRALRKATYAR